MHSNATVQCHNNEIDDGGVSILYRGAGNLGNRNESRVVPSVLKGSAKTVRTELDIKLVGGHP